MAALPVGAQLLSSEEGSTQAACSLPLDTAHPRSPGTLHHMGFTGMGCVGIGVFWSLICCWVKRIFLWLVSGFSGKTGQPSAGNFWSLRDRDLLARWCVEYHTSTTSHISTLPVVDQSGQIIECIMIEELDFFCADVYKNISVLVPRVHVASVCKHSSFCHMLSLHYFELKQFFQV